MFSLLKRIRDCFNYYVFGRLAPEMIAKINDDTSITTEVKENLIASIMTNNPTQLLEQLNNENNNIPTGLKEDLNASIMIATQPAQELEKTPDEIIKEFCFEQNCVNKRSAVFACACECGRLDIVKFMIERGVNDWNTGLYHACRGGHLDIVRLMTKNGADNMILELT
jgi:hypothetical protein